VGSRELPRAVRRGPTASAGVPSLARRLHRGEDGVGPIATVFGVAIFLGFLMLATQVLVHLYASSTVSAVAFDVARRASADGAGCAGAPARAYQLLGTYGDPATVSVTCAEDGEMRSVTITGPTPARMVDAFGAALGTDRIERTASVRIEQFRPAGER
jgi:hypothetical protein